jgi:hypothetical protein
MESFRLCWQAVPGGRTECTAPTTQEIAMLRLREQMSAFPSIRCWVADDNRQGIEAPHEESP